MRGGGETDKEGLLKCEREGRERGSCLQVLCKRGTSLPGARALMRGVAGSKRESQGRLLGGTAAVGSIMVAAGTMVPPPGLASLFFFFMCVSRSSCHTGDWACGKRSSRAWGRRRRRPCSLRGSRCCRLLVVGQLAHRDDGR